MKLKTWGAFALALCAVAVQALLDLLDKGFQPDAQERAALCVDRPGGDEVGDGGIAEDLLAPVGRA